MDKEFLKVLTVSGNGVEKIQTTSSQIRVGIEARGLVATEVQQEIAHKSSAVVALLRSLNVKQLKTTGVGLKTHHDSNDDAIEYLGNNTIFFSVPIDRAGMAIDKTVKAGASHIDGITFTAAPEAISAAKQEALSKATLDAKNKAEAVLSTLDLTLKEIIRIAIDRTHVREIRPSNNYRRRTRSSANPPENGDSNYEMTVVGGEIAVSASVTLEISY